MNLFIPGIIVLILSCVGAFFLLRPALKNGESGFKTILGVFLLLITLLLIAAIISNLLN